MGKIIDFIQEKNNRRQCRMVPDSNKIIDILKLCDKENEEEVEDAVMEIHEVLQNAHTENPKNLTKPEANIFLIEELESEINSGGFDAFFWNSYGDLANETLVALKEIKSCKWSDIFERAMAQFPDSEVPKNRDKRQEVMGKIEDTTEDAWNKLDDEFCDYEEDIHKLLIDYIESNSENFR